MFLGGFISQLSFVWTEIFVADDKQLFLRVDLLDKLVIGPFNDKDMLGL